MVAQQHAGTEEGSRPGVARQRPAVREMSRPMTHEMPRSMRPRSVLDLQRSVGNRATTVVVQRVIIAGVDVWVDGGYVHWSMDGKQYHFNFSTATPHVTLDGERIHYFFKRDGLEFKDARPEKSEQGGAHKKHTKRMFSELPDTVRDFVVTNFAAMLALV